MPLDYSVFELKENNLEGDLEGFLLSLQNLSPVSNLTLEQARQILQKINSQEGHIYIAKTPEGKVIGTTTLFIEYKFGHGGGRAGHIEDVSVRQGYERKGIGSSLVKRALYEAKKHGCYKVILDCQNKNVEFYQKFGFSLRGSYMRIDF